MVIAQLSDLHVNPGGEFAYQQADTLLNLKKTLAVLKLASPDLVILTGDIADNGHEESYTICKSLLDQTGLPYFTIPGNHDHKPTMVRVFKDTGGLARAFDQSDGRHLCHVIQTAPLLLIAMDTVLAGEHGGGLDEERLLWLDKVLCAHSATPACIFMHHPPFLSAISHMDLEAFKNQKAFLSLIHRHKQIIRVACGHVHRPVTRALGHTIATICPAVGMQIPLELKKNAPSVFNCEPPAFMLHCYKNDWNGEMALLTHIKNVEPAPGEFDQTFPFFDVAFPD